MVSTLLLRLAGPMQSWGSADRFGVRFTEREPTKSGVLGLICAAMGIPRGQSVDHLAGLRMGVRVEREGTPQRDYHTVGGRHLKKDDRHGLVTAEGDGKISKEAEVTARYYLADADFLLGLEGEHALLEAIEQAVREPRWQLYLGRKSFVPGVPVHLPPPGGLRTGMTLEAALREEPALPRGDVRQARLVLETEPGPGTQRSNDQPVGAAFETRRFAPRYMRTEFVELAGAGTAGGVGEP